LGGGELLHLLLLLERTLAGLVEHEKMVELLLLGLERRVQSRRVRRISSHHLLMKLILLLLHLLLLQLLLLQIELLLCFEWVVLRLKESDGL
jgi:hypothetical protein